MKVLFLSAASSTHTVRWVNALCKRGHEIFLVYNRGHEAAADKIDQKVKTYELPFSGSKGYYLNAVYLKKLANKLKPDVINAHYASGYGTLARIACIRPVLLSVWGSDVYDFPNESKIKKRILKKNILAATKIASTSECMARELKKVVGKPLEIEITPFGVDLDKFNPERFAADKDDHVVTIGNIKLINQNYGIKELILVAEMLIRDKDFLKSVNKEIRVEIYGDGDQRTELEQYVKDRNLQDIIHFNGQIANEKVPEALSKMDIFCALSHKESFGVSAVEAMAMGLPVVVSNAEGFQEVTENNITGYTVSYNDLQRCKELLKKLIRDRELRLEMGSNGRRRVAALYDWGKNVLKMEQIYREVSKV